MVCFLSLFSLSFFLSQYFALLCLYVHLYVYIYHLFTFTVYVLLSSLVFLPVTFWDHSSSHCPSGHSSLNSRGRCQTLLCHSSPVDWSIGWEMPQQILTMRIKPSHSTNRTEHSDDFVQTRPDYPQEYRKYSIPLLSGLNKLLYKEPRQKLRAGQEKSLPRLPHAFQPTIYIQNSWLHYITVA